MNAFLPFFLTIAAGLPMEVNSRQVRGDFDSHYAPIQRRRGEFDDREFDERFDRNFDDLERSFRRRPFDFRPYDVDDRSDVFGGSGRRCEPARWERQPFPRDRLNLDGFSDEPDYLREPSRVPSRRRAAPPQPPSRLDDRPDPHELISRRYQDPGVVRLIGTLSAERAAAMYAETLNLIETRHLSPPQPQELVQRGVLNLLTALENPAFLQANRVPTMARQSEGVGQTLAGQLQSYPVRTSQDAVAVLQAAMQIAGRNLGLSPGAVALEFEYGALEALDRYSAFVPQDSARATNQQLGEELVGIGVQIEAAEGGLLILKVIESGPAEQAGLQKGDVIVAVDDQPLAGRDLTSASSLIGGPEGTIVRLQVERQDGRTAQMALPRRSVAVRSVTDVQMIDPSGGVGYLKLETFASNSTREMEQALWTLHQQGMRSLVLDLRGDPGGLLTTAVELADLFLTQGTIVSTRGRTASDNTTQSASRERTWKVPLVLLVDENSASASEILAAAIQENGRGVVVGRRTYGKGTVQTLFPLQSAPAGLRLTTAKFYSPNGRAMAGEGVEPDVPVSEDRPETRGAAFDRALQTAVEVAGGANTPGYDISQRTGPRNRPGEGRRWREW